MHKVAHMQDKHNDFFAIAILCVSVCNSMQVYDA